MSDDADSSVDRTFNFPRMLLEAKSSDGTSMTIEEVASEARILLYVAYGCPRRGSTLISGANWANRYKCLNQDRWCRPDFLYYYRIFVECSW